MRELQSLPERRDAAPSNDEGDSAGICFPQRVQDAIRDITDAMERAFDACHRVGKFYECVAVNEPDSGMWLLDVMRGLDADDKPQLTDPHVI